MGDVIIGRKGVFPGVPWPARASASAGEDAIAAKGAIPPNLASCLKVFRILKGYLDIGH